MSDQPRLDQIRLLSNMVGCLRQEAADAQARKEIVDAIEQIFVIVTALEQSNTAASLLTQAREMYAGTIAALVRLEPDNHIRLLELADLYSKTTNNTGIARLYAASLAACDPCPKWMESSWVQVAETLEAFTERACLVSVQMARTLYQNHHGDSEIRLSTAQVLVNCAQRCSGSELALGWLEMLLPLLEEVAPFETSLVGEVEIIHDPSGLYRLVKNAFYQDPRPGTFYEHWYEFELSKLKGQLYRM